MNRTDSAFDETFRLKATETESTPIQRANTASTRHRRSKRTSPDLTSLSQTTTMGTQRPASEKRSTTHRKPIDPPRKSATYSSDNSTTKSRRRDHGSSLPSSRRTSCTVVDPSRPARHYRIKSSQTCPTTNRDIDDVLALHFRSCSLFQNPTYHSGGLPSPTLSGNGIDADTDFGSMRGRPGTAPHATSGELESPSPKESEETVAKEDTTMHWISPTTRRTQYEKIDKANSGFLGFVRKILPRCVSGPPPQQFYEKDKSDAGSVRRYRMDVSDEEDEEHDDEKSTAALRMQRRKLERTTTHGTATTSKRWGCF